MTGLRALASTTLALLALACTTPDTGGTDPDAGDETGTDEADTDGGETHGEALRPNWHQDVAPLVADACRSCHTDGGIAPFSMDTYDEAAPWSALMAESAESGLMPPWHALETEVCQPELGFEHDPRLDPAQVQMLRDWTEMGAPEGDPDDAAPLPEPPSIALDDPTATVTMDSPLTVDVEGSKLDFIHCISLDPGHTDDVYLDGLQIVEGNKSILHHVLVYVDETGASADWPGGVQEDCEGGAGVQAPIQLVAGWVPGSLPVEPPEGVGIHLPAGARLILNVHYHATGAGPETDDGTGLALRWTQEVPEYTSFFSLLGAPGDGQSLTGALSIPAGASDHVESYEWQAPDFPDDVEARIWAVGNHMHLVGVDQRAWLVDAETNDETCLLHTPNWDFSWQRIYEYDAPADQAIRVRSGDRIRLDCVYDNTLANPGVVSALAELGLTEPVDVGQGDGTLDEMCITGIGIAVKGL